jgi:plastocyanin
MPLVVASAASSQLRVVVADTRGTPLPDAVVSLRPTSAAARAGVRDAASGSRSRLSVSGEPVVIQQLDREFVPRVTVVPVGARVSLPNNDAVPHSVYSFSPAKQFEFDVYVGSSPQVLTLDKAGLITLGCNIHDWMVGYIVVVDAPFALRTDARGTVSFATMPEGDYELRVWHSQQRTGDHVTSISLTEQDLTKAVALDVAAPRARYKPPLTLKRY